MTSKQKARFEISLDGARIFDRSGNELYKTCPSGENIYVNLYEKDDKSYEFFTPYKLVELRSEELLEDKYIDMETHLEIIESIKEYQTGVSPGDIISDKNGRFITSYFPQIKGSYETAISTLDLATEQGRINKNTVETTKKLLKLRRKIHQTLGLAPKLREMIQGEAALLKTLTNPSSDVP